MKVYKRFAKPVDGFVSNGHASFFKGDKEGEMVVVSQKGNDKPIVEKVELFKEKPCPLCKERYNKYSRFSELDR